MKPLYRGTLSALVALGWLTVSAMALEKTEKDGVMTVRTVAADAGTMLTLPAGVYGGFQPSTNEFFGPLRDSIGLRGDDVVFLARNEGRPVILCTSEMDAAGGAVTDVSWDDAASTLSGKAQVKENGQLEIRLLAPPEPTRWVVSSFTVGAADAQAGVTTDTMQTRPWLRVWLQSPTARTVAWTLAFTKSPAAAVVTGKVTATGKANSPRNVSIFCPGAVGDLVVRRDDGVVLPVAGGMVMDSAALPGRTTTYTVFPLSWNAAPLKSLASVAVTTPELPPLPPTPDTYAAETKAMTFVSGWNGAPRRNLTIEDKPILIRGEEFKKGIGTHAPSEIAYRVLSNYRRFVAVIGVDDEKDGQGSVTFSVLADDKPLFESGPVTAREERRSVNVEIPKGTKVLRLLVGDAGDGNACDHADWANAGFLTEGEPSPEELQGLWLQEGFTPLFDGKSLAGWDGDPGLWSVQDGAIVGTTTAARKLDANTFLVWQGAPVKNFILKLKFRIGEGNSGVQYRSRLTGKWQVAGYQADIASAADLAGLLYEEGGRGKIAEVGQLVHVAADGTKSVLGAVSDAGQAGVMVPNEWNDYTITARGKHIVHELNGVQRVEVIDEDAKGAAEGIIALQLHTGPPMNIAFKEIQIRTLGAEFGVPIQLFDGKTLKGWTYSSDNQKDTWAVRDGVITDTGQPAGYIRTEADYTNYALRVQLRHVKQGNSGVLVRMVGPDKVWPRAIESQGQFHSMGDIWNIDEFPMKADPNRTNGRHTVKMYPTNETVEGVWNQYEITLDGGDLEIRVNGLLQNSATDCWETPGKICLQSEGAQMEFRNVTLIPITKTSAAK